MEGPDATVNFDITDIFRDGDVAGVEFPALACGHILPMVPKRWCANS
ncbi:MAG TPA: hypothetical protein VJS67_02680 [Pseudonocardiaceae bacterium]|nr:hypothetical protein [Pseudonocardiaceae bacterium]